MNALFVVCSGGQIHVLVVPGNHVAQSIYYAGDSGEAERWFRKEAEPHSGMIPNTIGA